MVKAKDGAGSATLSMAYAGFRFAERVMQAVKGKAGIVEPTFVYLPGVDGGDAIKKETGCDYFSVPVELGPQGAVKAVNIIGRIHPVDILRKIGIGNPGCGLTKVRRCRQRLREEASPSLL